jgi:glycosyltransferase involved in cell wall biosynthesis
MKSLPNNGERQRMPKIFQLIRSIHLGGAEMVAFNLSEFCKSATPDNFELVVVEVHQTDDAYSVKKKEELRSKNIRMISLGNKSKIVGLLIGPFILTYHLLKEKPQIVHSHTDLPDLLLSNTKRIFSLLRLKFPKIIRTVHNTELWATHYKIGLVTEKAFKNENIVGVSVSALKAYNELRTKYSLPISAHQQIIYNGCAVPQREEHPFKIDSTKINIAFCGRFENQKGVDILIDRIKEINNEFGEIFLFHLIGSGTYLKEIQFLAGNHQNVLLYDAVPNISEKLFAFDFLIMPSRFEGLSLMSIEASFAKVPVIAALAPGLDETLPPHWALQFNLNDSDELLGIFEKIKNNEYNLEALKNEAYTFVSENFSQQKMIEAYSRLYAEITE